jgi:hypothetical protein
MFEVDGLSDLQIPIVARGGSAVGQLIGDDHLTLAGHRAAMTHLSMVCPRGILEFGRDPICYAYRDHISEARVVGEAARFTYLEIKPSHGKF